MTENNLFSLLAPILPDNVFPYVAQQDTPSISAPWCVFSFYDVKSDVIDGQSETLTNIQIDVYAKTPDEARAIRERAFRAIAVLGLTEIVERQTYEPDTTLFRATFECQVWQ